jgi:hypothetical protein
MTLVGCSTGFHTLTRTRGVSNGIGKQAVRRLRMGQNDDRRRIRGYCVKPLISIQLTYSRSRREVSLQKEKGRPNIAETGTYFSMTRYITAQEVYNGDVLQRHHDENFL